MRCATKVVSIQHLQQKETKTKRSECEVINMIKKRGEARWEFDVGKGMVQEGGKEGEGTARGRRGEGRGGLGDSRVGLNKKWR
jgi:hypothetical protein